MNKAGGEERRGEERRGEERRGEERRGEERRGEERRGEERRGEEEEGRWMGRKEGTISLIFLRGSSKVSVEKAIQFAKEQNRPFVELS
jgi:hypothetical protein